MVDKVPPEASESENLKAMQSQAVAFMEVTENGESDTQTKLNPPLDPGNKDLESNSTKIQIIKSFTVLNDNVGQDATQATSSDAPEIDTKDGSDDVGQDSNEQQSSDVPETSPSRGSENGGVQEPQPPASPDRQSTSGQGKENGQRPPTRGEGSRESIEQFEPGVYITFIQLRNGTKVFKRVRFSKRRFAETEAEEWWKGNRDRVLRRYVPPPQNNATTSPPPPPLPNNPPPPSEAESNETTPSET